MYQKQLYLHIYTFLITYYPWPPAQIVAVGQLRSTVLGQSGLMFAHSEYNHPVRWHNHTWRDLLTVNTPRSPGSQRSPWSRLSPPGPSCPNPRPFPLCTAWWLGPPPCPTTVSRGWPTPWWTKVPCYQMCPRDLQSKTTFPQGFLFYPVCCPSSGEIRKSTFDMFILVTKIISQIWAGAGSQTCSSQHLIHHLDSD